MTLMCNVLQDASELERALGPALLARLQGELERLRPRGRGSSPPRPRRGRRSRSPGSWKGKHWWK